MKTSRAARVIHPYRGSGRNEPGYSRPAPQQLTQAPQPRAVSLRAADARTSSEALAGLLAASRPLTFVVPRFLDRLGASIRVGAHEIRVPMNSRVVIHKADNGREFALISGIDGDKRLWVLTDKPDGVREVQGLSESYRNHLRCAAFGES